MLANTKIYDHFVEQATWCEALGSPFTARLNARFARNYQDGGPIAEICADWSTNPRKDALGLRLAGYLHYSVLSGACAPLAAAYPRDRNDWDMDEVWPLAETWLESDIDRAHAFLHSPPQTNEPGRSIIFLPGFLQLAARFQQPMHLLEIGASAGLNQNWDRFNYQTQSWSRRGDSDVQIGTDWRAPIPAHLQAPVQIASRSACDLNPIDLTDPDQARRLKCYTWADQPHRLERLDAAIRLAQDAGTSVEKADALAWLVDRLANRPANGLTVIYHSAFLIYPPQDVIAEIMQTIRGAGAAATETAPLAWLSFESEALFGGDRQSPKMRARLEVWPGDTVSVYADSDGHVTYVDPYSAGI
ncbi:MAG: DUF2332 domain-containing protein [Pseudomonadota bacterium]